jgi:hypothetical protein
MAGAPAWDPILAEPIPKYSSILTSNRLLSASSGLIENVYWIRLREVLCVMKDARRDKGRRSDEGDKGTP